MTNLLQFDLSDVPEHPSIVLAGRRRSGKGVLAKDLCYNFFRGKIKNCFLFSPTAEIATNGFDYVPIEFRYSEIDVDVIDRILKRQEYLIRNNPKGKYGTLIIIDDIISSNDAKQQKILDKLFICARHYQISLIVCFQQSNFDNKDALNRQYLSVNDNKKDGLDLINKYATGFQTLTILNTINSDKYEDFCYYYEADIIKKKFKIGNEYDNN